MQVAFFSESEFDPRELKRIFRKVVSLALKEKHLTSRDPYEVSIVFTDASRIREINNKFRHVNRATDVLSFAFADEESSRYAPFLLGDIFICTDIVAKHAEKYGTTFETEMVFMVVHGMLHLLGFDHRTKAQCNKMKKAEDLLMARLVPNWSGHSEN